jgi:hypothetical protein
LYKVSGYIDTGKKTTILFGYDIWENIGLF